MVKCTFCLLSSSWLRHLWTSLLCSAMIYALIRHLWAPRLSEPSVYWSLCVTSTNSKTNAIAYKKYLWKPSLKPSVYWCWYFTSLNSRNGASVCWWLCIHMWITRLWTKCFLMAGWDIYENLDWNLVFIGAGVIHLWLVRLK